MKQPYTTPAHIEYRRTLLDRLTKLIGETVSFDTHPQFYGNWSTSEIVTFNERLVGPERITVLVRAVDDEHRGEPERIRGDRWHNALIITGREPQETNLDWSQL